MRNVFSGAADESARLPDSGWILRLAGLVFTLCSLALVPWSIFLGYTLPHRQVTHHYNVAWAGFDVMLLVVMSATAYCAFRRSPFLAVTAASAATMLVVDAWFDIMTSSRQEVWLSIVMAVTVELPAGGCLRLAELPCRAP